LKHISVKENVDILEEGLDALFQASGGDMRKAINLLQAAAAKQDVIDDITIYEVLGKVSPEKVREMLRLSLDGNFLESREVLRELLIDEGLAPDDIIRMVYTELMKNTKLSETWKVKISDTLGTIDYRLTQGARAEIQLSTLLAHLAVAGEKIN
jgi:replication factor C small subunit